LQPDARDKFNESLEAQLQFYEYFHGVNGARIGANHQTGWTGLIAGLTRLFSQLDAKEFLEGGKTRACEEAGGLNSRAALFGPVTQQHIPV
jgi:hypothetical protein